MTESDKKQRLVSVDSLLTSKDWGGRFCGNFAKQQGVTSPCICHACIEEHKITGKDGIFPLDNVMMILCPICGNKRCPHAENHRFKCTGSNKTDQIGELDE